MSCASLLLTRDAPALVASSLQCPIPARCNPYAAIAQARSLEWACRLNLVEFRRSAYQRLESARFGWLAAQTYPDASIEDLVLITNWATWFFLHDDLCDHSEVGLNPHQLAKMDAHFIAILNGSTVSEFDQPLALALKDITQKLYLRSGKVWCKYFADSVKQCFEANLWESLGRIYYKVLDRCLYLKVRLLTGAVYTGFNLITLAWNIDPDAPFLCNSKIQQLTRMAGNLICWHNDILSLSKEIREGNPYNLVLVLQQEGSLSLSEAQHQAIAMCNQEMQIYLHSVAEMPNFHTDALEAQHYLDGLSDWIRGHLDWCLVTHRYQT